MAQKILAGRCTDPLLRDEFLHPRVDQVAVANHHAEVLTAARRNGLVKASLEAAVAYSGRCVTTVADQEHLATLLKFGEHGLLIARPGAGFPAAVHAERFASPARLCVTDDARLAALGGLGMLVLATAPYQVGVALAKGATWMRAPRSIQVQLTGKLRPFVGVRDALLEILRRGIGDVVARLSAEHGAPVVIEFGGPSVRLLSIGERCVLASGAPRMGAAAALFPSDERTEVYLRDQRRSKAHRALISDAGAPCDEVIYIDLAAIDPLVLDPTGRVRAARDMAGTKVSQVVLGGDSGMTLRDFFTCAALLKSKRVSPQVEFLVAMPSLQVLEACAAAGVVTDLVATGARIVEPDHRLLSGAIHPPPLGGISFRTTEAEPGSRLGKETVVASPETLAMAVSTGTIGDPRAFKRPPRVALPRALPTEDPLISKAGKGAVADKSKRDPDAPGIPASPAWKAALTVPIAALDKLEASPSDRAGIALVCRTTEDLRAATLASEQGGVRVVLAAHTPAHLLAAMSAAAVIVLKVAPDALEALSKAKSITLGPASKWPEIGPFPFQCDGGDFAAEWPARGFERTWAAGVSEEGSPASARKRDA